MAERMRHLRFVELHCENYGMNYVDITLHFILHEVVSFLVFYEVHFQ